MRCLKPEGLRFVAPELVDHVLERVERLVSGLREQRPRAIAHDDIAYVAGGSNRRVPADAWTR